MRYLNRLAWAVAALAVTAATGGAQQPITTSQTVTPGGTVSTTTQGGGGQMGQGQTTPSENAFQLQQLEAPPQITPPTGTGSGLDPSNRLGGWYANPLALGSSWDTNAAASGGFGTPSYGGTGGAGGAGGARGTQAGRVGTQAGRLGTQAGRLGAQNAATQSGTVLPMQVNIAYPAVPRFDVSPLPTAQVQADVSGMLSRATAQIPGAANVQAITTGNIVTLRGNVSDIEEARLIEGMTRLTPGVRSVRNELTFPASASTAFPGLPR
jgi:hypothetical protein